MNTNYTKELLLSTPLPQETNTYKPISHEQLIDLTLTGIEKSGFILEKEIYSSAQEVFNLLFYSHILRCFLKY